MMRHFVLCGSLLVAAIAAPSIGNTQIKGAKYCSSEVYNDANPDEDAGTLSRIHPLVSRARYGQMALDEKWDPALRGLRLDAVEAFTTAQVSPQHQLTFLLQLDSVIDLIARLPAPADAQRAQFISDSIRTIRFLPIPLGSAYQTFRGPTHISVTGMSPDQMRALCWSAMSIDQVLFRLAKPLEGATLARLARLNRSWANYRTYGYTRQPLELMLWPGSVHDTVPPNNQWILAHLSAGAELRGNSLDSASGNQTAVVEAGYIRYRNNYTQYSGASLIASIASERTIGYGVLLHFARGMRAGAVFRRENGHTKRSLLLSTDLYGLLERSKKSVDDGLAIARGIVVLPKSH